MSAKTRMILAGVAVVLLGALLLPRLARRIDDTLEPKWQQGAANDARYRDMTNAYPIAGEVLPEHPTRKLWEKSRAALLESGFIETREFSMQQRLSGKGVVTEFFKAFQTRFPGVECSVRGNRTTNALVVITARKSDFGPLGEIEQFVTKYEGKGASSP